MRTGRARLIETLWDLSIEVSEDHRLLEDIMPEYADRIMEDINLGIITAEVDG